MALIMGGSDYVDDGDSDITNFLLLHSDDNGETEPQLAGRLSPPPPPHSSAA